MILAHAQNILSQDFRELSKTEKQIARKELFVELPAFKTQSLANFMFDLEVILKTNQLNPNYNIYLNY